MFTRSPLQYAPVPGSDEPGDVEKWLKLYDKPADRWVAEALLAFQKFSQAYSDHFFKEPDGLIPKRGFDPETTTIKRLTERVFRALDNYWTPLGQVAEQRQVNHYREILDQGSAQATTFLQKLRLEALPVLIYFDKVTTIRHCPYTNAIFVGTPYRLAAENDWMAIPHEIGHYLYWNLGFRLSQDGQKEWLLGNLAASRSWQDDFKGRVDGIVDSLYPDAADDNLRQALKEIFRSWLEEMFADQVGVLIGGAKFVDAFQQVIERSAGDLSGLLENDGEHPPLYLRPFFRALALKRLHERGLVELSQVDWDDFFKKTFNREPADFDAQRIKVRLPGILQPLTDEEDAPSVPVEIGAIKSAIKPVMELLDSEIAAFKDQLALPVVDPEQAFRQLRALSEENERFAAKERLTVSKTPFERLLQPRILEGGDTHSHGCWGHWGQWKWHEIGEHPI